MKTNHDKLLLLINDAIQTCSYDAVFNDVKRHLREAQLLVTNVAKKRGRKLQQEKERLAMEEKAKNKNKEWWKMLQENAGKLPPLLPREPDEE